MMDSSKRSYESPIRKLRADDTRQRIVEAARKLFRSGGYAQTTIDAIAQEAGVAAQTVYAVFRSKQGILAEVFDQARFGSTYQETVRQVFETGDPAERLRLAARIARQIYDAEQTEVALLRGVGMVAPELAKMGQDLENRRLESQRPTVQLLAESGQLQEELDEEKARDLLWTLTGREIYHMLVIERGWKPDAYEQWLAELLIRSLLL